METETKDIILDQKESVKLSKGMAGKYGWEIKLLSVALGSNEVERLEAIDKSLNAKFGTGYDTSD